MSSGKFFRLRRLFSGIQEKSLIVPMDHGVTVGAIKGIDTAMRTIELVSENGANGIVLHKGLATRCSAHLKNHTSLIVHMSASTTLGKHVSNKVQVCTVDEAVRIGADAVSVHINMGSESEPEQMCKVARVAEECDKKGMPLLVMTYARGEQLDEYCPDHIAHSARVAYELGADLVKCHYTGDRDTFQKVIQACPIPILIAGGEKKGNELRLFEMIHDAILAGASGVSIGRNIFEHDRPDLLTRQICKMIHENMEPQLAYREFTELLKDHSSIHYHISSN